MRTLTVLALCIFSLTGPALASSAPPVAGHEGHAVAAGNVYADAMNKMHRAMPAESSGNADVDFIKGMIPHHQGAIDMAEVALQNSSDPFIRKLSEDIIAAQKSEIEAMQKWLAEHEQHSAH